MENTSESSYESDKTLSVQTLLDVSEAWVADHAKHVTRMLPGGMFVHGNYLFFFFNNATVLRKIELN